MAKQILLIDPLEKLNSKKDSSLMLALGLQEFGIETYIMFAQDLYFSNIGSNSLKAYKFKGCFEANSFYLKEFLITEMQEITLQAKDCMHMRLDPPFDSRYLRYIWLLGSLEKSRGVKVINSPSGILTNNEKLVAYESPYAAESFVGEGKNGFILFCQKMLELGKDEIILKPLDLYQGIGVEKVSLRQSEDSLVQLFLKKVNEYKGPVICQPFISEVQSVGEVRAFYFGGIEFGSILKTPPKGEFLANIAQGASYKAYELNKTQKKRCDEIAKYLMTKNVPWVAYDLLGDYVSEVNITCPGLVVEISQAHKRNFTVEMAEAIAKF